MIKNEAKNKFPLIVAVREQLEHRALWMYLLCDEARKKGVSLYFKEVYNERIIGDSFALVEHNFDLDNESKIRLVKFIKSFFNDWDYTSKGIQIINLLKAVRFLKVDGEMIKIN